MVNKELILNKLKSATGAISGQKLSEELNISRTAIWKNIKSLINEGYQIEASKNGYTLNTKEDMLTPYEFDGSSEQFIYKEKTTSTMDLARDLVLKNRLIDGSIIVSDIQESGVGKYKNKFESPLGGLYFTMVFLPDTPMFYNNIYPIAGTIAVHKALYEILNIKTEIKWPFENHFNDKKISGIITEYHVQNNRIKWLNLGIGINCDLKSKRRDILLNIKTAILKSIDNIETLVEEYSNLLGIIGNQITLNIEGKTYKGCVKNIDSAGTITIESSNDIQQCFIGNSTQED